MYVTNMKTTYREYTIEKTSNGFCCEFINCFACRTRQQVEEAIDRYALGIVVKAEAIDAHRETVAQAIRSAGIARD